MVSPNASNKLQRRERAILEKDFAHSQKWCLVAKRRELENKKVDRVRESVGDYSLANHRRACFCHDSDVS